MIVSRLINHHFCEELWNHQLVSGISHVQRIYPPAGKVQYVEGLCKDWSCRHPTIVWWSNIYYFPFSVALSSQWLDWDLSEIWSKLKPPSNSLKMGSRWPSHPAPGRAVFWLAMRFAHFLAWWVAWLQIMILAEDCVGVCEYVNDFQWLLVAKVFSVK